MGDYTGWIASAVGEDGDYTPLAMRWLLMLMIAVGLRGVGGADSPVLVELLNRTGEQVRRFEQAFTPVISEENYRQHASGQTIIGLKERRTRAEMLFLWLPEERVWLTVRNVVSADGHPVAASEGRLDSALQATGSERLARLRRVIDDNARFNVGPRRQQSVSAKMSARVPPR